MKNKNKGIIENIKHSLDMIRSEMQDIWNDKTKIVLCESLLQVERNLEEVLKDLGVKGYKRTAFKG